MSRILGAAGMLYLALGPCAARAQVVTVPGTANIFGSGHLGVAATPGGGTAPVSISVLGLSHLTVSVTGTVNVQNGQGFVGPDSLASTIVEWASVNGVAGYRSDRTPAGFYGVFTGAIEPVDPAPSKLDFVGNTSFAILSPDIDQIFFIGDGLTGTGMGTSQVFTVPVGATTLHLGVPDGGFGAGGFLFPNFYFDNTGSYVATFTAVPEPSSLALLGLPAMGWWIRRRRKAI